MPAPQQPAAGNASHWLGLSRRAWVYVGIAFALGLLLFVLLFARDRNRDFFRVQTAPTRAQGQVFEPLPTPSPGSAIDLPGQDQDASDAPTSGARIDEPQAPLPPPPPPAPPSAPAPSAPRAAMAPGAVPVPVQNPSPRYPAEAMRRRESGTVRLRVQVDENGVPRAIEVLSGSGSRALDREAANTVRRWRFLPAQRDGRPVEGSVDVPITFRLDG